MIIVVSAVVVMIDDRILLVRENKDIAKGKYGLPGGKLEEGESVEECAIRECAEETGYEVSNLRLFMISQKPVTHEGNTVIKFIFQAQLGKKTNDAELDYEYIGAEQATKLIGEDLIRGKDVVYILRQLWNDGVSKNVPYYGLRLFT